MKNDDVETIFSWGLHTIYANLPRLVTDIAPVQSDESRFRGRRKYYCGRLLQGDTVEMDDSDEIGAKNEDKFPGT